jgi:hypothetical protein
MKDKILYIFNVPFVIVLFTIISFSLNALTFSELTFNLKHEYYEKDWFRMIILWGPLFSFLLIFAVFCLIRRWKPEHIWAKPLVIFLTVLSLIMASLCSFFMYLITHMPT